MTCMLACSLAHEVRHNLSLSRIQVMQNPFEKYPDDIYQIQCRQCVMPACVASCPSEALHMDTAHGNVRIINEKLCTGCDRCVSACWFAPERIIGNPVAAVAQKCDLCVNAPYWNSANDTL